MPHPATMFFLLTLAVILLSWIFDVYGLSVLQPQTGEEIRVQSLLSPEGIRWLLRHVITNFTGFAPLGLVIVAMFGIGVAQHSGFIDACIRRGVRRPRDPWRIILLVIVLGLLSNIVGDAGYIILLPIAATLFQSVGLHPIGGIITAYVSVSCGYSANVFLSTLDPMIASVTQEAADRMNIAPGQTGPLCNYYFLFVSTFLLAFIIYHITRRSLLPRLGSYLNMNTVVSLVYRSGNIRVCTFFSLFRMIESVPNAVIVNESSVSFNAIVGLSGLMVYIVQYIIGRPANEQSFSSEQAL